MNMNDAMNGAMNAVGAAMVLAVYGVKVAVAKVGEVAFRR
jgi:hypothetical protein